MTYNIDDLFGLNVGEIGMNPFVLIAKQVEAATKQAGIMAAANKAKTSGTYPPEFEAQWASPSYQKAWNTKDAAYAYWLKSKAGMTGETLMKAQERDPTKFHFSYQLPPLPSSPTTGRVVFGQANTEAEARAKIPQDAYNIKITRPTQTIYAQPTGVDMTSQQAVANARLAAVIKDEEAKAQQSKLNEAANIVAQTTPQLPAATPQTIPIIQPQILSQGVPLLQQFSPSSIGAKWNALSKNQKLMIIGGGIAAGVGIIATVYFVKRKPKQEEVPI